MGTKNGIHATPPTLEDELGSGDGGERLTPQSYP